MGMFNKSDEQYEVGGFLFLNESEAIRAKKELEGVKYIRGKVDMEQPQKVLEIYNRMITENMFSTVVGISYLRDLQEYLTSIAYIKKEDLRPIPVVHPNAEKQMKEVLEKEKQKRKKVKEQNISNTEQKRRYQISFWANIVLLVCVIFMFIISATSNHPNILNYETKLINRYSAWEQELNEREEAIRALENK